MKKIHLVVMIALAGVACNLPLAVQVEQIPTLSAQAFPTATTEPTAVLIPPTLTSTPEPLYHFVAEDESLQMIAALYGVSAEELIAANDIATPDVLPVGLRLLIPINGYTPPTPVPTATPGPASPTPTLLPTPTESANPLAPYSIAALRVRNYDGGTIVREEMWEETAIYEQWTFSHTSDGIRVTGLMNIPCGEGPFPVAVLLHGGLDQSVYTPGDGNRTHAQRFAQAGYLAIMPDYRSYNNTAGTGTPYKVPWAIDVMNLIEALPTLPEADPERIGVMGHSRGGGIATYIMVLSDDVDAMSLYAPLHTDQAVVWDQYVYQFRLQWPLDDAQVYGSPESNPEGFAMISPSNYLDQVRMPVQIHHGDQDPLLPVQWSRDLFTAMQNIGLEVSYYEYPGASHSFYGSDYEAFITRNINFFDEHVR